MQKYTKYSKRSTFHNTYLKAEIILHLDAILLAIFIKT